MARIASAAYRSPLNASSLLVSAAPDQTAFISAQVTCSLNMTKSFAMFLQGRRKPPEVFNQAIRPTPGPACLPGGGSR